MSSKPATGPDRFTDRRRGLFDIAGRKDLLTKYRDQGKASPGDDRPGPEKIMVVGRSRARRVLKPGFTPGNETVDDFTAAGPDRLFLDRTPALESDDAYLQVVAYVVIRHLATGRTFYYRRPDAQGEPRLSGKLSVGLAGHVSLSDVLRPDNPETCPGWRIVRNAALRELAEEVTFLPPGGSSVLSIGVALTELRVVGSVYDPTDDVGRVHYGVVFEAWTWTDRYRFAADIADGCWASDLDRLRTLSADNRMESWSSILLRPGGPYAPDYVPPVRHLPSPEGAYYSLKDRFDLS